MLNSSQLDQLLDSGYLIIEDAIESNQFNQLQHEAQHHLAYRDAKIIDGLAQRIRSDRIAWIESQPDSERADLTASQHFISLLNTLSDQFNRSFYAGIRRVEAHFACYKNGNFYARHVDNPQGQRNRVFSCVFYLNTDWTVSDGGELVLYTDDQAVCVLPTANRMIIFDSNLPHEVKPAFRTRYSIAAWLRRDN